MGFFEEPNVLRNWCLFNDYWVNRSLRVLNEPSLNSKMIGIEGFPTIDLVFKHAQNQAVYWFIVGVIDLLNGKYR